jgi:hypothetical protein
MSSRIEVHEVLAHSHAHREARSLLGMVDPKAKDALLKLWTLVVLSGCACRAASTTLSLTDRTFDQELREYPVAMVAFVSPWCGRRCAELGGTLEMLTASFADSGVGIASASSDTAAELLDRFQVYAFPTLLWFDAAAKWPHYASDAKPERYAGDRGYDALLAFIEQRIGFPAPLRVQPPPPPQQQQQLHTPAPRTEAAAWANPATMERVDNHACKDTSATYASCMRHRRDRPHLCARERHEYLLCMSGRWSVHPDDHAHLAARYSEFAAV